MGKGDIVAVSELLDAAAVVDGHRPLGEHQWLDLVQGGRQGFAGLVAWESGHEHPVGYAQVSRGPGSWALEFVIAPHHRKEGTAIAHDLLSGAIDVVRSEGGGHVHVWVPKPRPEHDEIATSVGLVRGRDLLQLRRELPVEGETWDVKTRPFEPGRDEAQWLEVNNRAFAWHPEQGRWDLETLQRRGEGGPGGIRRGARLKRSGGGATNSSSTATTSFNGCFRSMSPAPSTRMRRW